MQTMFEDHPVLVSLMIFLMNVVRYSIIAGLVFLVYYRWRKEKLAFRKIQSRFPKNKDYQREILYSISTAVIFTLATLLMLQPAVRNHNLVYRDWAEYGTVYGIFSFIGLLFLHDTYFYWTHRAMHHPKLFPVFHLIHHKSTNPSPWAAYSFHPLEALVEASIVPLAAYILPLHPLTMFTFLLFMIAYNVYGHLGWELYPANFNRHWLGKWLNTSISHNQHHQHFKGNYGLYFRFWDEWMGTTRQDYDATFDAITEKAVIEMKTAQA